SGTTATRGHHQARFLPQPASRSVAAVAASSGRMPRADSRKRFSTTDASDARPTTLRQQPASTSTPAVAIFLEIEPHRCPQTGTSTTAHPASLWEAAGSAAARYCRTSDLILTVP